MNDFVRAALAVAGGAAVGYILGKAFSGSSDNPYCYCTIPQTTSPQWPQPPPSQTSCSTTTYTSCNTSYSRTHDDDDLIDLDLCLGSRPAPTHMPGETVLVHALHVQPNRAGIDVKLVDGAHAFLPASCTALNHGPLEEIVGSDIKCRVLEWSDTQRIVSRRAVLLERLGAIAVGSEYEATIKNLRPRGGALAEIEAGIVGFCRTNPARQYDIGGSIRVRVEKADATKGSLILSDVTAQPRVRHPIADRLPPTIYEGVSVEFKRSVVYSAATSDPDIDQAKVIAHTAASFANQQGGIIYIGVADDGRICGIENDLAAVNKATSVPYQYPTTQDGLRRRVVEDICRFGGEVLGALCELRYHTLRPGMLYATLRVKPSYTPIFADHRRTSAYVRFDGETRLLDGAELRDYIANRWPEQVPLHRATVSPVRRGNVARGARARFSTVTGGVA